jgi:hypothetical protein
MLLVTAFATSARRDHAVQRDMFNDPDLSHFESPADIYTHLLPKIKDDAIDLLDNVLTGIK